MQFLEVGSVAAVGFETEGLAIFERKWDALEVVFEVTDVEEAVTIEVDVAHVGALDFGADYFPFPSYFI
jgi:hypothetical protein